MSEDRTRDQDQRALFAALAAVFLGAVDLTVISTILPSIVLDLQLNTADIDRYIWIVNAYLLAYVVAIPIVGRLSDVAGRQTAFQLSLALFLIGSVASALSDSLPQLIAARALQGAGGGALLPVTMALVADLFPEGKRLAALGLVGAVDTLGWVLGPIWGAAIVALAGDAAGSWRWVFWINLPLGGIIAVFVHRRLGPTHAAEPGTSRTAPFGLDVFGALLLGASLLLLNLGLSSGGEVGISSGSAARALGGSRNPLAAYVPFFVIFGALLMIAFVWWQRRTAHPLLPPALMRNKRFVASLVANFIVGASLVVAMVDVPIVVALLADEGSVSAVSAWLLAPFTLLMAAGAYAGGRASSRIGERRTEFVGVMLIVSGYALMWLGLQDQAYVRLVPGLAIAGAGFGLVVAPLGASAIDTAAAQDRGVAAGSAILFRLLGMTLSLSALTAFGVSRLQRLTEAVEPITRKSGETTATFLLRQNQYIEEVIIPLSVQVVQETFLIAAALALTALLPMVLLTRVRTNRDASL